MVQKILIANRGEIACRIIRTSREMGIATVAVFSEPDRRSLHVQMADEAHCIGPAAAASSYLNGAEIVRVACEAGADAVHPGYGFLSENPEFAAACVEAGLVFIGPSAEVITAMGIKGEAKQIMANAGIPVIPGGYIDLENIQDVEREVHHAGFPLLIKADRGGGGKGIRLVRSMSELAEAARGAAREASSTFGNSSLLWEKYIVDARHIEVQVFRDTFGNAVHLFERDCSLQRRHQKIIEEAPAADVPADTLANLHKAAVTAAQTIGYIGAGTVEFLVEDSGRLYFLEINTRLQVEHPVTEMITGQDLVKWQLLIAGKKPLPCTQEELRSNGHAIEARIYAEDPSRDFLPSTGWINYLQEPVSSETVRVDSGIREGDTVTPYYDPILAKLIVHAPTRNEAIHLLRKSLLQYRISGVTTNIPFLAALAADPSFLSVNHTIQYVDHHLHELIGQRTLDPELIAVAACFRMYQLDKSDGIDSATGVDRYSPWSICRGFRINGSDHLQLGFLHGPSAYRVDLFPRGKSVHAVVDEKTIILTDPVIIKNVLQCRINDRNRAVEIVDVQGGLMLFTENRTAEIRLADTFEGQETDKGADGSLRAPLPGKVTDVLVREGQEVGRGEVLLVLEAMKMEYSIRAPSDGQVVKLRYRQGDMVQEQEKLLDFINVEEDDTKGRTHKDG